MVQKTIGNNNGLFWIQRYPVEAVNCLPTSVIFVAATYAGVQKKKRPEITNTSFTTARDKSNVVMDSAALRERGNPVHLLSESRGGQTLVLEPLSLMEGRYCPRAAGLSKQAPGSPLKPFTRHSVLHNTRGVNTI